MKKSYGQRVSGIIIRLTVAYLLICLMLFSFESRFVYMPFDGPTDPVQAGLEDYRQTMFTAADGEHIPLWKHTEAKGPVILYFHGNGGGLHAHAKPLAYFAEHHMAITAMEYRGYPGAPGKPSEKALVADAIALYDHVRKIYPDRPIVVWGYSLGSGVATQLAAQRPVAALVLEAPFSAAVDVAKKMYPIIPVDWLMRDQFLSREAIGRVHAPLFIMHGEADTVIPILFSEQLYARANEPKEFHRYPHIGHMDLRKTPAYRDALDFIAKATRH